jgi:hypothetical protein
MADIAELQRKAVQAVLRDSEDEIPNRTSAEARVQRAQLRLEVHARAAKQTSPLERRWQEWSRRLAELAKEYDCPVRGTASARQRSGVALLLDLIPGHNDAMGRALLKFLAERDKPTISFEVASLPRDAQTGFVERFADLVLDPIASFANLFITVDSMQPQSRQAWKLIERMGDPSRVDRALEVAGASLLDLVERAPPGDPEIGKAAALYKEWVDEVRRIRDAKPEGASLWECLRVAPCVLDLATDRTLQQRAEKLHLAYYPDAATTNLGEVAKVEFAIGRTSI